MANQLPYCLNNRTSYNKVKAEEEMRKKQVWKNVAYAKQFTYIMKLYPEKFQNFNLDVWFFLTHWLRRASRLKNRWQLCRFPLGNYYILLWQLLSYYFYAWFHSYLDCYLWSYSKKCSYFLSKMSHYELCNIQDDLWWIINSNFITYIIVLKDIIF